MILIFEYDSEELAFLKDIVHRLYNSQGRLTAYDSMDLDYAWDLMTEYCESNA